METQVFLIDEHKENIFDSDKNQEWLSIVQELGLSCQENLMKENKSPLPFPAMTRAESTIWGAVLETKTLLKDFSGEAIPLPVLSAIALCEREHYFDKIEIWYSRQMPDPIVVGKNYDTPEHKANGYDWSMIPFKIAQWGAILKPITELIPLWDKFKRAEIEVSHQQQINAHETELKQLQFTSNAF
jgi:hypothetical protein